MKIHVDLETYSSVDIKKAGLYRYVIGPAFQILLFAYCIDDGPVQVVDLTAQELPAEIRGLLFRDDVTIYAYNAAFEWRCLSVYFGLSDAEAVAWLPRWRCTMVHGLYCGLPAGLGAVGEALGLPADKQKARTGAALIRYFCSPCRPTKSNGGRVRNLPHHDPDKWALFIEYNRQDVEAERAIEDALAAFPVPADVWQQWRTDMQINLRGIAVDRELVDGALELDAGGTEAALAEAAEITGLHNPKSLQQLRAWLEARLGTAVPALRKADVDDLLAGDLPDDVRRVLELRQATGKTSTAKYAAIASAVCDDGRLHGLLQFYGAGRTGRWAGRLVQPQNLPRTYIAEEWLPLSRALVQRRDADGLRLVHGPALADTLAQLVRTALTATPGRVLVDADFSAIEARVLAWLAGESWSLAEFRGAGKIYEATAGAMFGVDPALIKKGRPEYSLRAKGKIAVLALGYGGGVAALKAMGALSMGITEAELPDIVEKWRAANGRVTAFWHAVEDAALQTIRTGADTVVPVGGSTAGAVLEFRRRYVAAHAGRSELDFLQIVLPSGRVLHYAGPGVGSNRWGQDSITYHGTAQASHQWTTLETYGGKLAENITQAVARDLLAEALERLEAAAVPIVLHIHDEVVADVLTDDAAEALAQVVELMEIVPAWAAGLPLAAAGWTGPFFRKD